MVNAIYSILEVKCYAILIERRSRKLDNIKVYRIINIIRKTYIVSCFKSTPNISDISYFTN